MTIKNQIDKKLNELGYPTSDSNVIKWLEKEFNCAIILNFHEQDNGIVEHGYNLWQHPNPLERPIVTYSEWFSSEEERLLDILKRI